MKLLYHPLALPIAIALLNVIATSIFLYRKGKNQISIFDSEWQEKFNEDFNLQMNNYKKQFNLWES